MIWIEKETSIVEIEEILASAESNKKIVAMESVIAAVKSRRSLAGLLKKYKNILHYTSDNGSVKSRITAKDSMRHTKSPKKEEKMTMSDWEQF